MSNVTITINKANVYNEVAKTTSYVGAKKAADGSLYEQIFTTDEDRLLLERFWGEAANAATDLFKPFVVSVTSTEPSHGINLSANYSIVISPSNAFDSTLTNGIQSSLFAFFVNFIASRWFRVTDPDNVEGYEKMASELLTDVKNKLYYRKKPTRTIPT